MQVVYGAPLVKGKNTAFRVKVNSTFYYPIETKFGLILPDTQWYKWPSAGGVNFTMPPDWSYPEIWGPIKIPARARNYEVILPIIPEWETRMGFGAHSPVGVTYAGVIPGAERGGVFWPDTRVVPRPIADRVSFTVEIDPNNEVGETNEGNNRMVSPDYEVVTTKRFKVYYTIHAGGQGCLARLSATNVSCPSTAGTKTCRSTAEVKTLSEVCSETKEFAKSTTEYLLGVAPIADSKIFYDVACNVRDELSYDDYMGSMLALARENDFDYVLSVEPCDCCGCCGVGSSGCFIGLEGKPPNGAHELLGHGIQEFTEECYDCAPDTCPNCTDVPCDACGASEGFWVNRWISYETGTWGVGGPTYYMDSVGDIRDRWQTLDNPRRYSDGGELNGGYLQLIEILQDERDPKVLLVRGIVYKNGSVNLGPFTILKNGTIDIEPGEEGNYYIILMDSQRKVLSKVGFDVSFYLMKPEGRVELDHTFFVYRIEWKEGTNRIELQDKNGDVLASREVSSNAPEIEVLYPNGGEVWERGKTYKIKWQASDKDGDLLTYSLAISKNGAETWLPIDIDITGNEYELNTVALEEGQNYLVRVRATDGVNTEEDVSDGVFTITTVEKAEINWWLIIGIVVGVVIIASALVIRSRKKA